MGKCIGGRKSLVNATTQRMKQGPHGVRGEKRWVARRPTLWAKIIPAFDRWDIERVKTAFRGGDIAFKLVPYGLYSTVLVDARQAEKANRLLEPMLSIGVIG